MGRSVRISEEAARRLDEHLERYGAAHESPLGRVGAEIRGALARLDRVPKSKPKTFAQLRRSLIRKAKASEGEPPHVSLKKWAGQSRRPSKAEKVAARAAIREKVFARAAEGTPDGVARCEGPAGSNPRNGGRCIAPATDLQHAMGRGKGRMPESERNCLAACRTCHDAEGRNDPSGWEWWEWFAAKFQGWGFHLEAEVARRRAHLEKTRSRLPAAPRVGP